MTPIQTKSAAKEILGITAWVVSSILVIPAVVVMIFVFVDAAGRIGSCALN